MKLVKISDIMLTVDGNGVPIFFEPVQSQQNELGIEGHKRSDLRTFEVLLTDFFWATFSRFFQKVAQKKSVRSTSKVRRSLRLWPSILSIFCWDCSGSKKMGTQGQSRLAWFMQDSARPHTAHASLKHLRGLFKNRLIGLNTDEWAPTAQT